jgi:nucleotide-binding universal stress UspA family protein
VPRRLLVGHDGSPASTEALLHAGRLACSWHGRVTVVLALPHVPFGAVMAPVSVPALEEEAQLAAERELCLGVRELAPDVSVTSIVTGTALRPALLRAWRCGEHDAVVLAAGGPLSPLRSAARALRRQGLEPIIVGARPRRRLALRPRRRARAAGRARAA